MSNILTWFLNRNLLWVAYVLFILFAPIWFLVNFIYVMYAEFCVGIIDVWVSELKYMHRENKRIKKETK